MSLHLVFSLAGLEACLARRESADLIVLMSDATFALTHYPMDQNYAVLASDAASRGLDPDRLSARGSAIKTVDYADLVALTEAHTPIVSWRD